MSIVRYKLADSAGEPNKQDHIAGWPLGVWRNARGTDGPTLGYSIDEWIECYPSIELASFFNGRMRDAGKAIVNPIGMVLECRGLSGGAPVEGWWEHARRIECVLPVPEWDDRSRFRFAIECVRPITPPDNDGEYGWHRWADDWMSGKPPGLETTKFVCKMVAEWHRRTSLLPAYRVAEAAADFIQGREGLGRLMIAVLEASGIAERRGMAIDYPALARKEMRST